MAKTRPISERDTAVRPAGEIVRRLAFLAYVLSGAGGALALLAGLSRKHPPLALAGGFALVFFAALHLTRRRWRADSVVDELKRNPFKPTRIPKDEPS